ncbi:MULTISPECIES: hypothetical protein [unclassified Chitinophaga]|uniref:hypothetical protein n=1 Tax=unclassified Chitinophaga TaxID=2619133 RepID=UPI0009C54EC3|nr:MULTISPECIES: hypothetical protein [unclassified Chitinophaga]OMP75516.1 hypothetical protein BW716_29850 [[Flexibacter] sp. ATCC 35208]WPV65640.1 hypothetical protein QQL36_27945 [Chitinophaga sp. LS1]
MKNYLLILAALFLSCKRDATTQPATPPITAEKVTIHLQLSGDITTSIGDLRKAWIAARSAYDSTIYGVNIRTGQGTLYAQGLFDNTDSISIDLLKDSSYIVNVAAIKRGSSLGLWWQLSTDGYKQYAYPIHRTLRNRMFYAANETMETGFIDSLNNMSIVTDTLTNTFAKYPLSEADTYFGSTNYTARDSSNTTISLQLKRLAFAIRYDIHNLTSGYLQATYGGQMIPDTIHTNDTLPIQIYTADLFRTQDSIPGAQLQVTLTWINGSGNAVVLGTKPIRPKRSSLTAISVFLTTDSLNVTPNFQLTDTTWTGTTDFDF